MTFLQRDANYNGPEKTKPQKPNGQFLFFGPLYGWLEGGWGRGVRDWGCVAGGRGGAKGGGNRTIITHAREHTRLHARTHLGRNRFARPRCQVAPRPIRRRAKVRRTHARAFQPSCVGASVRALRSARKHLLRLLHRHMRLPILRKAHTRSRIHIALGKYLVIKAGRRHPLVVDLSKEYHNGFLTTEVARSDY